MSDQSDACGRTWTAGEGWDMRKCGTCNRRTPLPGSAQGFCRLLGSTRKAGDQPCDQYDETDEARDARVKQARPWCADQVQPGLWE